jgi:3-hydroxybutyryl-CoA dehydratase
MKMEVGESASYVRKFTDEDVRAFAEISGDRGIHHMHPDGKGRIMVQGLLTATLPTKLGGDLNFIAAEMSFRFIRPVFVGDTVRCEAVVKSVARTEARLNVAMDIVCTNQTGAEVLSGSTRGIIRL